jgi:hypothetical protein
MKLKQFDKYTVKPGAKTLRDLISIVETVWCNLNEAKDPDAEKIISAHEKRIAILQAAVKATDQETREFEYVTNDIANIMEKVKDIAKKNNVSIDDQIDEAREAMALLSQRIYELRTAFTDAISDLEFEIDRLDWEQDFSDPKFDLRNHLPPKK